MPEIGSVWEIDGRRVLVTTLASTIIQYLLIDDGCHRYDSLFISEFVERAKQVKTLEEVLHAS